MSIKNYKHVMSCVERIIINLFPIIIVKIVCLLKMLQKLILDFYQFNVQEKNGHNYHSKNMNF